MILHRPLRAGGVALLDRGQQRLGAADAELHRIVASASGNRMVTALTEWIFEVLQPSLLEALRPAIVHAAVVDQHEALLAAIEKGDAARAERAMKDHLLYLRDLLAIERPYPVA